MTSMATLRLTDEERATFANRGFLLFPGLLAEAEAAELRAATDDVSDSGGALQPWQHPRLRELIARPHTLALLDDLFGAGYAFHHLHVARQGAGTNPVPWHHDYEQLPQTNRNHLMVHVFYYLNGLNGEVGDLLLFPGSHRSVMRGDALFHLGTPDLPGSVTLDDLPPGSMAIVHSALLHARRAKPGGEGTLRYFLDASYCGATTQWPAYWFPDWQSNLDELRAWHDVSTGVSTGASTGAANAYPDLFDARHFFDRGRAHQLAADLDGSIVTRLPEWSAL
jgi:hypothetical protein